MNKNMEIVVILFVILFGFCFCFYLYSCLRICLGVSETRVMNPMMSNV